MKAEHDIPAAQGRLYLSARQRADLLQKQGGTCCVPGCTESEGLIGEHSTPNVWQPGKPDQLMCVAHHKIKTKRDIKAIAKVKRIRKGKKPSKRKILNRGFDKRLKRGMNGKVVER